MENILGFPGFELENLGKSATMRAKFETTKMSVYERNVLFTLTSRTSKKKPNTTVAQITDSLKFLLSDPILTTENAFMSQPKYIKGVTYTIFPYASDTLNASIPTYITTFISLHPIHTHIQILKEVRVAQPALKNVQICLSHIYHTLLLHSWHLSPFSFVPVR